MKRTAIIGLGTTGLSCLEYLYGEDELVVLDTRAEPPHAGAVNRFPDAAFHLGVGSYDFEGVERTYDVTLTHGDGVPYGDQPHGTGGFVTLALPQGAYELEPSVVQLDPSGGESINELERFPLTVGCRQVVEVSTALQLEIDDVVPCSPTPTLNVTGRVLGDLTARAEAADG